MTPPAIIAQAREQWEKEQLGKNIELLRNIDARVSRECHIQREQAKVEERERLLALFDGFSKEMPCLNGLCCRNTLREYIKSLRPPQPGEAAAQPEQEGKR